MVCFYKWCFYKWCVFTNCVFLQIVCFYKLCVFTSSVDVGLIVLCRYAGSGLPHVGQSGAKTARRCIWKSFKIFSHTCQPCEISQFKCELSEYSPDIRICIHMSCQVLSSLLDKAVCFNCQWKAHLKNDLVLNRPSFGALSQGIFTKSWDTCEVQMDMPDILTIRNSGIWIYTYKSMISTSFHRTQVRSSPCLVTL